MMIKQQERFRLNPSYFLTSNTQHQSDIFLTAKQLQKIKKIQERVLRFLNNNYKSDYSMLLKVSGSVTVEVKQMRYLCMVTERP